MKLSLIIPVMNECENIKPLVKAIDNTLTDTSYEIIFVDDGSVDDTVQEILKLKVSNIKIISFVKNFGQTSALSAGIEQASAEYVVTLDGDLQNDPQDIPLMLKYLQENNLDLVSGVRQKRNDGFILRKIPSKIANFIIRKCSKVNITDTGCTLKIIKSSLAKKLDLYGELHRFMPILASLLGAKIGEIPVRHHSRIYGQSKYGINRTFKVLSDLMLLIFFQKYRQKPMHLFGTLGLLSLTTGIVINIYLLCDKIMGKNIGQRPLFFIGILCLISAFQFITTGFIAELLMRTYYGSQKTKPYLIYRTYENGKWTQQ